MKFALPYSQIITAEIERLLDKASNEWPAIFTFDDYFKRMSDYSVRGKMVRSNLVILSWHAYQTRSTELTPAVVTLAAIQELSESGLLLQDDVMDNDILRRGKPTMHLQYRELALQDNSTVSVTSAGEFGKAWATILGDLLFFYLFRLLVQLPTQPELKLALIDLYSNELAITGSGQLADLAAGFGVVDPTQSKVGEINRQKTAHYTICLPMLAGAILAGQSKEELVAITTVGETIGEIFQLTDDRLDLFSSSNVSGKTQASDVKSGKKTMLYFFTVEGLQKEPDELIEFNSIYGKADLQQTEIERVQQLVKKSGGYERSEKLIGELAQRARQQLNKLSISESSKQWFYSFVNFLVTREH